MPKHTQSGRARRKLGTHRTSKAAPSSHRLEVDVLKLSQSIVQKISQWESKGHLEYVSIRLHRVTPTLKILRGLVSLKELNLSETRITDKQIRQVSKCRTLVKITLNSCRALTNVNLLSSIAALEIINLASCTSLTHMGALGKLPVLKEIDLSETPITDEEVELLSKTRTLVKIDLHFCRGLTNVNPLSSIATLEVINLSDCTALTHVGALGKFPAIKEVDLGYTRITDDDVRLLSKSRTLVMINMRSCRGLTNVNPLSSIATLEIINLASCTSLTHMGALGKLPVLRELNLSETRITDNGVRLLSENKTLVRVNLHSCILLKNVNPLAFIWTLEVINLSDCKALTYVGALGKLPVLKELKLGGTPITDEEIRQLSESHTLVKIDLGSCRALSNVNPLSSIATLEDIYLYGCNSLSHVGELSKLPVLKELNVSKTSITDEEVRLLSESNTLVKIDLGACEALTNVDPLFSIETLEEIDLSFCASLTHVGALGKLPVLKNGELIRTSITDANVNSLTSVRQKVCLPPIKTSR